MLWISMSKSHILEMQQVPNWVAVGAVYVSCVNRDDWRGDEDHVQYWRNNPTDTDLMCGLNAGPAASDQVVEAIR